MGIEKLPVIEMQGASDTVLESKLRSTSIGKKSGIKSFYAKSAAAFRWIHIYVSMLGFAALMFFAWTGITLNHPTWFGATTPSLRESIGRFREPSERKWLEDPIQKLEIAEHIRHEHRLKGQVARFEPNDFEIMLVFKGPGYAADVFIERSSGNYTVSETVHGFASILNDLHKGRDSGKAWGLLIDISAIVMMLMSLSGFGLLFYLKRRRAMGILVSLIGTLAIFAVWFLGVP